VFLGIEAPYRFRWRLGFEEEFEGAFKLKVLAYGREIPVEVAYGEKHLHGMRRKRILVVVRGRAVAEFEAVDGYEKNGLVVALLKKPATGELYKPGEEIPLEFTGFKIVRHKDYVGRGYDGLAILFNCLDIRGMVGYSLAKARLEGII